MPSSASLRLHLVIDEERLRDRAGIGQPGRLDQDVVELVLPLHQVAEDADQVAAHGAADAAVVHLEDLFLGVDDELLIDADLAELVLDDGDPLAVLGGQDAVEQGRLARAEEAGQHRDRNTVLGGLAMAAYSWLPLCSRMMFFSLVARFNTSLNVTSVRAL